MMPIIGPPELLIITSILFVVGFLKTASRAKCPDAEAFSRLKVHLSVLLAAPAFLFILFVIVIVATLIESKRGGAWESLIGIGAFLIASLTFVAAPYVFGFFIKRTLCARPTQQSNHEPPR